MIITDKILSILRSMSSIKTVMYDNNFSANQRVDRAEMPGALLYTNTDYNVNISKGYQKESCEVEIFFFDVAQFDSKGETKDIIVTNQSEIAKEFLAELLKDKSLRILSDDIKFKSCWGKWDKFVVGISLEFTIEEKQGSCLYIEPEPEPEPDYEPNEDNTQNEG